MMPAPLFAAILIALPDARLAQMRAGIRLPDGTNVAVAVALETRVDGMLALRTQFSTEVLGVQVFAGGPDTTIVDLPEQPLPAITDGPDIRIERDATGTVIGAVPPAATTTVRLGTGADGEAARLPGTALPVTLNGPAVVTALGAVRLIQTPGGSVTRLDGPDLSIQQLVGQATGTIIANTASDRVIDTVTWVSVQVDRALMPAGLTSSVEAVARAVADRARF